MSLIYSEEKKAIILNLFSPPFSSSYKKEERKVQASEVRYSGQNRCLITYFLNPLQVGEVGGGGNQLHLCCVSCCSTKVAGVDFPTPPSLNLFCPMSYGLISSEKGGATGVVHSVVVLLWVCPGEASRTDNKVLAHLRVGGQSQDGNCHLRDLFAEFLLAIAEIRPEIST